MMAEELRALSDTIGNRPDDSQDAETAALQMQLSDLSAAMGDLARTAIRAILSDTVVDMTLLKEWYGTIVETMCTSSLQQEQNTSIPVEAYLLAEVYSTEGDYAAADALLASLPQRFSPDEPSRNEYGNYLNLQRLRENVAGNWYRQAEAEIADLQQVAEYDNGRAARMAKEILCFFHHICYEDEPLFDLDGIGERGIHGDGVRPTANADGLHLHPNPANTTLTVESDSPVRTITIYDLTGKTMLTVANCPSPATINVVSLPRGIYLLRAVTDNGVKTARFVKN
jgi:HPt (histidine-containing phosphotransfer) domain-containing protein